MLGAHTNQKLVGFWTGPEFLRKIDLAQAATQRSQFIRDVIEEKLRAVGFEISREEVVTPDRAGKGNHPKVIYRLNLKSDSSFNEASHAAAAPTSPVKKIN
ncbi:MAG: hypothetical protein AAB676_09820 [Verrucomicrobiota bacterium]